MRDLPRRFKKLPIRDEAQMCLNRLDTQHRMQKDSQRLIYWGEDPFEEAKKKSKCRLNSAYTSLDLWSHQYHVIDSDVVQGFA